MLRRLAVATLATVLLAACDREPRSAAPNRAAAPPSVVVQPAGSARERLFDGRVEGTRQMTVRAQTAGRVATVAQDVNAAVAAGAVVLRLRGVEQRAGLAQAESGLREAQAREAEVQQRYRRIADLYERKVVAKAAFDEVTAARTAAVARVEAAHAARESAAEGVAYADVAAPFAGTIAARHVDPGDLVIPGAPLFDVASPQHLRVVVDVPQSSAESVRVHPRAVVLRGEERIPAASVTVFATAAPVAGTVRLWIELPHDASGFFAGQFVRVALPTGGAGQLTVPATALVERSEVTGVYVVDANGSVGLRQVRVGHRSEDSVEVLAGLSAGDRVVTQPLAALRLLEGTSGTLRQ